MHLAIKIVGGLVGVSLTLFVAALAINLFDEQPTPTARSLLTAPSNPYPAQSNIYVAMAGFTRSSDAHELEFHGGGTFAAPLDSSIWSIARAHPDAVVALRNANQELYARYLALHDLQGYFDTARPPLMAPTFYVPQLVQELFLADVATRVQTGTPQQQRAALSDLQKDLLLWKAVLKGNSTLPSKMLAAGALHADLLLVADFVNDPHADLTLLDANRTALVIPFDLTDWHIGGGFAAELRHIDSVLRGISWTNLQVRFFKLHATENVAAERMEQLQVLADANPADFSKGRAAYRTWLERQATIASPRVIYNPLGKIVLLAERDIAYDDYISRVYDVAAMQRLVCLDYQIRQQNVAAPDVSAFMARHPQWATHPIDGKPFHWDSATGTMAVMTAGTQSAGRRFSLVLP